MNIDKKNYEYDYAYSTGSHDDMVDIILDKESDGWEFVSKRYIDNEFEITFKRPIEHED